MWLFEIFIHKDTNFSNKLIIFQSYKSRFTINILFSEKNTHVGFLNKKRCYWICNWNAIYICYKRRVPIHFW